jgi:hypothetical protein
MKIEDLVIHTIYVVRGQGPMRLEDIYPTGNTRLRTLDGDCNYYASIGDIIREVDRGYVNEYVEALKARGIVPATFSPAW